MHAEKGTQLSENARCRNFENSLDMTVFSSVTCFDDGKNLGKDFDITIYSNNENDNTE